MTQVQKIVLIALGALALIAMIVALTLGHYIGGFMRTVEREAREEAKAREAEARDAERDERPRDSKE